MDLESIPSPDRLTSIQEQHDSRCSFNVMPGRTVTETLRVREYRYGKRYVEAWFDREYQSEMQASPSHLVFLTALAHTQKMLYLALCQELDLDYDPQGDEHFKMWPTKVEVKIPTLIAAEENLVQRLWLRSLKRLPNGALRAVIDVRVDSMQIHAVVPVFLIEDAPQSPVDAESA